jgi:hypothetical protein
MQKEKVVRTAELNSRTQEQQLFQHARAQPRKQHENNSEIGIQIQRARLVFGTEVGPGNW